MKIAILGSGNIGSTTARLFVKAGHEVSLTNSRGPESLAPLLAELGASARALGTAEAARWAEVVLLAVPWRTPEAFPAPADVQGKVVIDATNPYLADFSLADLGDSTSSEVVAQRLPGARLVKAFNTIFYKHLASEGRTSLPVPDRRAIFVAGDDADAKAIVMKLIEEIGFAPVDTGSLREGGRRQQPGTPVYNQQLTGRQALTVLTA